MIRHPRFSLLALIATVLLLGNNSFAQRNDSGQESKDADAALRDKAFGLLESLAGQIHTLQSAENRARIGANIADSLWQHDERQSRNLFIAVGEELQTALPNLALDDPTDIQTRNVLMQLRADTVERIARHDAELALSFLKATEPVSDKPLPYQVTENERNLELRLAKAVAADNPDLALKLGRQTLARGFRDDLLVLIKQLNRKHQEQAQVLYKEIVSKIAATDTSERTDVIYFARSLAVSFTPPAVDVSSYRELISVLINTALANGCANKIDEENDRFWLCQEIGGLLPQMEKVDPQRAAKLKQWAPESNEAAWPPEGYEELDELVRDGTVDEILALATKYPKLNELAYSRAVDKAESLGDFERAEKIANDYHGDSRSRDYLLARIKRDRDMANVSEEQIAQIKNRLASIPRIQERAEFLIFAANQIGGANRAAALKLLEEANSIIDTMKPGKEQTELRIGLAMMYCLENSDRGLTIMESLMPALNDLVAASAKLDGYDNRYLRDGEWNMTSSGSVGNLLTRISQSAGYFAWCDFDRAVSTASQFERPELRIMAQLKLAQAILAGRPKRVRAYGGPIE
jgi:hypothetical protein